MKYTIILIAVAFCFLLSGCQKTSYLETVQTSSASENDLKEEAKDALTYTETIFVQVAGAVKNPGVYEINANARVYEAIEQAGGLLDTADSTSINQAQTASDGQMIYVMSLEEKRQQEEQTKDDGLVNINTAEEAELMNLPGIGASKAAAIVDYRKKKGNFQSIEDLMQIPGIKEGVFQKIADDITVGM